jgi:hypothetical protein
MEGDGTPTVWVALVQGVVEEGGIGAAAVGIGGRAAGGVVVGVLATAVVGAEGVA